MTWYFSSSSALVCYSLNARVISQGEPFEAISNEYAWKLSRAARANSMFSSHIAASLTKRSLTIFSSAVNFATWSSTRFFISLPLSLTHCFISSTVCNNFFFATSTFLIDSWNWDMRGENGSISDWICAAKSLEMSSTSAHLCCWWETAVHFTQILVPQSTQNNSRRFVWMVTTQSSCLITLYIYCLNQILQEEIERQTVKSTLRKLELLPADRTRNIITAVHVLVETLKTLETERVEAWKRAWILQFLETYRTIHSLIDLPLQT